MKSSPLFSKCFRVHKRTAQRDIGDIFRIKTRFSQGEEASRDGPFRGFGIFVFLCTRINRGMLFWLSHMLQNLSNCKHEQVLLTGAWTDLVLETRSLCFQ